MKPRAVLVLMPLLTACTLDFDQFLDEPPAPDVNFRLDAASDAGPVGDTGPGGDAGDGAAPDLGPGGDADGDGVPDGADNCPMQANPDQADGDGDGTGDACDDDGDGDGVPDEADNCPDTPNPGQLDLDRDDTGDACDDDADGDGLNAEAEAARGTDPLRADSDVDGHADGADTCPVHADRVGRDLDGDMAGDACDPDDDGDDVPDWRDPCPGTANPDQAPDACAGDLDGDGVADADDNCPLVANADQAVVPCASRFRSLTYSRDVRALAPTADGLIAGTAGGLVVAEGDEVRVLTNADGLAGNRIAGVAADADGRRWVATDRGLVVLRPDGFVFTLHERDAGGGPVGALRSVAVDDAGAVWVSSDAGLNRLDETGWTLFGADALPSVDVRGLHVDGMGRLWAATAMGVVRLAAGAVEATLAGFADVGDAFLGVSEDADGTIWLLGEGGAVAIGPDDMPLPGGLLPGVAARDLAPAPSGRYLATAAGVRRLDADGRLYPPGTALLPSPDVRALAGAGPVWAGTAGGLVTLDGYFATYPGGEQGIGTPCVRAATRIGGLIWVGTDQGLSLLGPDGVFAPVDAANLPAPNVSVIRAIGDEVWVGTDGGIAVFTPAGEPVRTLLAADGVPAAPITDIVEGRPGEVWVASAGAGLARRDVEGNWTTFTRESEGQRFLANEIRALAHDGAFLWAATQIGLTVFDEEQQAFAFPVTGSNRLPSSQVQDVEVADGRVYAGTAEGVAVRTRDGAWRPLRRETGGWPRDVGSDYVHALAHDGTYLWVMVDDNRLHQAQGVLLRRTGDEQVVDGARWDEVVRLYNPANAGVVPAAGAATARLEVEGRELFVAVCGSAEDPGGLSILDGPGVVTRDLTPRLGLPGDGTGAHLTSDGAGRPLFATTVDGAAVVVTIDAEGAVTPFELPVDELGVPTECSAPPEGGDLWCVIEGRAIAHRLSDGQWTLLGSNIPALRDAEVRDIAVEADARVWVATSTGVVRFADGLVRSYNRAATNGGLPDDDVRRVVLGPDGRLYAATAAGVGIYAPDTQDWEAVTAGEGGALGNGDVLDVAVGADGALWIGTADGLYRRDAGGTVTGHATADGLPANRISSVAVTPDGRVLVGTPAGLAVGAGDGAEVSWTVLGRVDGLPGEAVHEIRVLGSEVWIRSDDGVASLLP